GVRQILAEGDSIAAVFDHDVAGFDSPKPAENRAARKSIDDRRAARPGRIDTRCDNGIRLGHSENPPCDTSSIGLHRIEYTRSHLGASASEAENETARLLGGPGGLSDAREFLVAMLLVLAGLFDCDVQLWQRIECNS